MDTLPSGRPLLRWHDAAAGVARARCGLMSGRCGPGCGMAGRGGGAGWVRSVLARADLSALAGGASGEREVMRSDIRKEKSGSRHLTRRKHTSCRPLGCTPVNHWSCDSEWARNWRPKIHQWFHGVLGRPLTQPPRPPPSVLAPRRPGKARPAVERPAKAEPPPPPVHPLKPQWPTRE